MDSGETQTLIQSAANFQSTFLGYRTSSLGVEENIELPDTARFKHVLSLGQTGTGKTQLLIHMALQDAYKGHGFCLINPKGGAIDEVIAKLPDERLEDIVYINPVDEQVTPINVLEPHVTGAMTSAQRENQKEIIVSDVIDLFRRQSKEWGDRFGRVLETLLRAHIELNIRRDAGSTLLDVFRCVVNDSALTDMIDQTRDPVVREQLVRIKEDLGSYELEPLQRRLNDFVMNPAVRRVIAAEESGVDFRDALNEGKIILVDVQKGDVGDTVSKLVGSIVITKVWAAAQSRITMRPQDRKPFFLLTDEVHNFSGEGSNFTKILSEGREYRLGCCLATQYLHQLEPGMRRAVSNNCRTKIVFDPSGSEDLSRISHMLNGVDKGTLSRLGDFRAVVQMPSTKHRRQAVVMDTYPPWHGDYTDLDTVKQRSTFPVRQQPVSAVGQTLGKDASAGGARHQELLAAAKSYLEKERDVQVDLLYQEAGSEKPDGHVIKADGTVAFLEAEASSLSRPVKVLRNVFRASLENTPLIFVVEAEQATKLRNIVDDPVNRRGNDHQDARGPFSYYVDEDGEPITSIDELTKVDYTILEVDTDGDVSESSVTGDATCPELDTSTEEALAAFCLFRDQNGFCEALGQPCVIINAD